MCLGRKLKEQYANSEEKELMPYTEWLEKEFEKLIPKSKKIIQLTLDGEKIAVYKNAAEAHLKTGCNQRAISFVCNGDRKTTGGFIWRYEGQLTKN